MESALPLGSGPGCLVCIKRSESYDQMQSQVVEKGANMASDSEVLESIDRKLSVLMGLQAYLLVREMTITGGAPILRRLGMTPSEIGHVFETSAATVSVQISKAKKKRTK